MTHAQKISAFVAMGLLMAVSTATTQEKASTATSGGEITYRTLTQYQGDFGPTGSVSSKWTEYRTMPNGTTIPSLKLWTSGGKIDFNLNASNVHQKDQQYQGKLSAYGVGLKFNWNEIPHAMGNDARSIYVNSAPGVWTMSTTERQALQTAVDLPGSGRSSTTNVIRFLPNYVTLLTPSFNAANLVDLNGERRTGTAELNLGNHLPVDVTFTLKHELKKGYRGQAGINENFRISPALQVGAPLDESTNDLGVRVARNFGMGNAYVTFNRSQYDNAIKRLVIDFPFQAVDAPVVAASGTGATAIGVTGGPASEQAVMAPNNSANSVGGGFHLKFARQTRVDVSLAMSQRKQNDPFLGYTAYTLATGVIAMPRASLDGKTNTTMYNLSVSSRPLTGLTLRAGYRMYNLQDKTAHFAIPGDFLGTAWAAQATSADDPYGFATANPYSVKTSPLTASATYDFKALTVEASVRSTNIERTHREAEKGKDKGLGVTALYHLTDWVGVRGTFDRGTRTAQGTTVYGYQADEAPFTNTRIGGDLELSLFQGIEVTAGYTKRKVDYTDRPDRCYVVSGACATNAAVTTPIPNSPSGLLSNTYDSYTGQIDWTGNDLFELGAYTTFEKGAQTNQWLSNPSATTYNQVMYAANDKTNTYGVHAAWHAIPDKATLSLSGVRQNVNGLMDITAREAGSFYTVARTGLIPAGTGGAADVSQWDDTRITTLNAGADYALTKKWLLGVGAMMEKYDYNDPFVNLNSELLPSSMVMLMKPNDGKYYTSLAYAKLTVKF